MPLVRNVFPSKTEKLKHLILLIAKEGAQDPALGATKVNKILYFAEVRAYLELRSPLTGVTYQHLDEGPAPRSLLPCQREMLEEGWIELVPTRYFMRTQNRIVVKEEPDLTLFTEDELRIVREVVRDLWGKSAKEVSQLSHDEWAWRLTMRGEDIPLQLAWLSSDPLTLEQVEFGEALAVRLNAR